MQSKQPMFTRALLATALLAANSAIAAEAESEAAATAIEEVAVVGIREKRVSRGATGLALAIKDTPQSISIVDQQTMQNFGITGANDALELSTGVNVDQYETNRATFNSRGFEIQLTQVDGLGMTNDFGTVVGQLDTFLFEKIELIRGANGLLTGVGNASGTINYVRKRPTNESGGMLDLRGGSYGYKRVAGDYNQVLTEDGSWASRVVVAYEDKDSHIRDLHDEKTSVYGVIDGQIGTNGVLTAGVTVRNDKQDSPMWGSLTLYYPDGSMADFSRSSSTSADWTYYDTEATTAFVEYTHQLARDWEAKFTYNRHENDTKSALLYAYNTAGNFIYEDGSGLIGWPYMGYTESTNDLLDANLSGAFNAFGREHSLIAGVSHSMKETASGNASVPGEDMFLPLSLPYGGDAYPEPNWGGMAPASAGEQELTRIYAATRLSITDELKAIVGVNAIKLAREGSSIYGSGVSQTIYPDTEETSPYLGLTYDFSDNILGYVSYSDIFQNQDQTDINQVYLDPMKGVNMEAGVKAEWFDNRLLTTAAVFSAEQQGLATFGGVSDSGTYWYAPMDVKSEGFELEAVGQISENANLTLGLTRLDLTGPDGNDIYEWVPRTTALVRYDTQLEALPQLRLGINGRWQSDIVGSYAKQDAFFRADVFASYELSEAASVRLNVNNLFDEKYVEGLAYGAIYGAPRHGQVSVEYRF
ncbi:TonB-dependent siderophore receptor [Microbulbifer sp. CAU 1566]|uniref:TonB-dependent siderophore receptor n=1 Tax=Microbulbifer sp. CAU 1566 TaxID=2933269 RepID=UPI002004E525|nr:TonB-dependent siderophore receptor [Microbulbifer sp. CAU 1566]MCK7596218.1 TonB-dependent siderophore receptor [Microbulbifer sp. CAU 1566]